MADFPADLFQFDERISGGWLSDRYFVRAAGTLAGAGRDPVVTLQVFAKHAGVAAGLFEAVRLLETGILPEYDHADILVETLLDGDEIQPWEPVMHITGPYRAFAHLESPLLGALARRTLVASNVRLAIRAANGKPVIFMAARHDDWRVQVADGYAARVGGASSVSSDAGGSWWGAEGVGTMPHALIAAFGGDTVEATLAFTRHIRVSEPEVLVVSLVDYNNDVVADSLAVARAMEKEFGRGALSAVRVDTSEMLVDRSLIEDPELWGRESLTGVNPPLILRLRAALDTEGFDYVGIVASGGFTPAKIAHFEREGVPVTSYGVGSSLLGHNEGEDLLTGFDFTADIVRLEGRPESKVGRGFRENPRLVAVDWKRAAPVVAGGTRRKIARIGWVVDVQNDFAKAGPPGGRLYVRDLSDNSDRGAELVEDNIVRAVGLLREACEVMVYTGDWHGPEDEEIDAVAPDPAGGTYPPHCMGRSDDVEERRGAEVIAEISPENPLVLDRDASAERAREVARAAVEECRPVFIQKDRFSVFEGNRAIDPFLEGLQDALGGARLEFYVLGHARDVCVTQFVDGAQHPSRSARDYRVVAISDCTAGLGLEPEAQTLARWAAGGAEVIEVSALPQRLSAPARSAD
ncbi:MAG TPA: hypothetical protein VFI91_05035 [Longimicrobiaceae bacterium]|nr:hypothetical protein [Longimicrobiaceae bacterium]